MIIARLKAEGLDAYKEEFEVDSFDSVSSQIEVIEPFHKTYDVTTYANSGSTGEDGSQANYIIMRVIMKLI